MPSLKLLEYIREVTRVGQSSNSNESNYQHRCNIHVHVYCIISLTTPNKNFTTTYTCTCKLYKVSLGYDACKNNKTYNLNMYRFSFKFLASKIFDCFFCLRMWTHNNKCKAFTFITGPSYNFHRFNLHVHKNKHNHEHVIQYVWCSKQHNQKEFKIGSMTILEYKKLSLTIWQATKLMNACTKVGTQLAHMCMCVKRTFHQFVQTLGQN